jgi:hypothetical protein
MTPLIRAYEAMVDDVSVQERMVMSRINTGAVDRYKTVIDPMGIDLKAYRSNPVVLWEHGKDPQRGSLPIGKCLGISCVKAKHGSIIARTQFGKDEYSQTLFDMYRNESLRGWSINVLPDKAKCSPPTRSELKERPELEECEMMYRSSELAEYSAVAVPGNAETLTLMEQRGIWFPEELRNANCDQTMKSEDGEEDDLDRYIKKVGDEWGVYSEAGELIAKHPTREKAVAQLQAIEAHKHDEAKKSLPPLEGTTFRDIHAVMSSEIQKHYRDRLSLIADTLQLMKGRV